MQSKILVNILQNHPLRFSIAASSSVLWIYLAQFWHTLKEDGSKYRLSFMLDRKDLTLTLDDFRTIFYLPQATNNNHDHFVLAPTFLERFTKLIVSHYMTTFPDISRRARDRYHNLEDDDMVKSIFNSGKHKDGVGMKILSWMITDEIKLTYNYQMYATMFGVDVHTTQLQPIDSTQGTHRTTSAPRTPNPKIAEGKLKQNGHEELKAKQNVEIIKEHLMAEEIEKLVEGTENAENVEVDSSILRQNDNQNDPSTRLEPISDKESSEVEKTTDISQHVNVIKEEDESVVDDYELKRREKGKHVEESRRDYHGKTTESSGFGKDGCRCNRSEISSQINNAITNHIPSQIDSSVRNNMSGHILHVHPTQATPTSAQEQQYQLYLTLRDNPQLQQDDLPIWIALKYKFEILYVSSTPCRPSAVRPRDQKDPHDDAHPEGENSAKRQKTSEHGTFVFGESSSGQDYESKPGPSTSGNQEQLDDFHFWTDSYAIDDDELPTEKVSQEFIEEMFQTVDEAKLRKVVDEMLRQQFTSGDEHQYHIDQMQNFLKNDIVCESRKEILVLPFQQKPTLVVQSRQRDLKAPALSLVNQDLLYLKKGNSGPEKIVLSLHKFPAVIFPDDDIKERTSRWVEKCVKRFNPYARYGVKHWKNPHAKIFYIKKQQEHEKPKEEVYSNSKIVRELSHKMAV
ncbi:hypothetical protein Tco_0601901 [Tanacetum coccineum]